MVDGVKCCSKCGDIKPLDAFNKNRTRRDGLSRQCRKCVQVLQTAYRQNNREKCKAAIRRWRLNNPEKDKAAKARWLKNNPDKRKVIRDRWAHNNKDAFAAMRRRWVNNNPDKVAEIGARALAIRRARLANAPGGSYFPTRKDYRPRLAFYGFCCAYCLIAPAETWDHAIPVSRGGSNWPANMYPACFKCNFSKHDKLLFKEWVPPYARKTKAVNNACNSILVGFDVLRVSDVLEAA